MEVLLQRSANRAEVDPDEMPDARRVTSNRGKSLRFPSAVNGLGEVEDHQDKTGQDRQ